MAIEAALFAAPDLDDMLDTIGLAYPYSRRDLLDASLPAIRRLHRRAEAHLARLYGVKS